MCAVIARVYVTDIGETTESSAIEIIARYTQL